MELDIYIPRYKVGIEYDGDYWHNIPEMIERDKLKDIICKERGLKLIRVLESEWYADKDKIIKNIKRILENNG